jgi:hypothetical protein
MVKKIIFTFSATAAVLSFCFYLFITPLLGLFNLTTVSIGKLQQLEASQAIFSRLKEQHGIKKKTARKKYITKLGKKLGSSSVAAATIGTVAVAATTVYFATIDYCEQQEEILAFDNVVESENIVFDHDKCLDLAKADAMEIISDVQPPTINDIIEIKEELNTFSQGNLEALSEKNEQLGIWFRQHWQFIKNQLHSNE